MKDYFLNVSQEVWDKAANIKLLITDVDGVLTDGGIIYDDNQLEYKRFQVKDGQIIRYLQENGIKVGAITGRDSLVVRNRCEELRFDFHLHGAKLKYDLFFDQIGKMGLSVKECAYIGDDIIDLPILMNVGLSAAPADAMVYVRDKVDFVSSFNGGFGAFREVADVILQSQGKLRGIVEDLSVKRFGK
ncbi:KdsC family phosphatase [Anditalea andensis]|uniref:3-deoxy-D-manno-octulosonate 8-phosphate phosphatase KdsC n=1 Tax=Anditalea andensis TaxID=1048983 RepID=A0A074KY20_9BACT|nr:HAD family hydrolase [Anditalea andensis]KEO74876.1 3-deoxy-manno-octulosonate-8-phosphatase [Anditalea andensis]